MAREIRQFSVSVPAGTAIAAPQLTALVMPARIVRRVRVRIPKGPNGQLGFALASSGVPIIPWNTGTWFVADDEIFTWDLDGQIDSGAWQLRAYNVGAYAHTVYLTFELDPPQLRRSAGGIVLIPSSELDIGQVYLPPNDGGGIDFPPEPPPDSEPPPFESDIGPDPIVDDPGGLLPPPPDPDDGYAIARANALAAVEAALGAQITVSATLPPAAGTAARIAYDAGRQAAISALELI